MKSDGKGLLGIIGGMGPYASAHFLKRLTEIQQERQQIKHEQDYIDAILYSKPSIPDRTAFITCAGTDDSGGPEDPFYSMLDAGTTLERAGCTLIAIPCVTAHYFYERLTQSLNVPVLHIIRETVLRVKERGVKKAGLLATDGTVKGHMFLDCLAKHDIETVIPSAKGQECLMEWIYLKAKQKGNPDTYTLEELSDELFELGAETVILGCTELSLSGTGWRSNHIDALDELAGAALRTMKPIANQLT